MVQKAKASAGRRRQQSATGKENIPPATTAAQGSNLFAQFEVSPLFAVELFL